MDHSDTQSLVVTSIYKALTILKYVICYEQMSNTLPNFAHYSDIAE